MLADTLDESCGGDPQRHQGMTGTVLSGPQVYLGTAGVAGVWEPDVAAGAAGRLRQRLGLRALGVAEHDMTVGTAHAVLAALVEEAAE